MKIGHPRFAERQTSKSNRTMMRPLGIYLIGIYIYNLYVYTYMLDVIHFLMILGDFGVFFLNANGRTDGHTDGQNLL